MLREKGSLRMVKINWPDSGKAKAVLVEAVRTAGGTFENRTNLYKAFYLAHLWCMSDLGHLLTDWPIVRLPRGPGVDNGAILLQELSAAGILRQTRVMAGPYEAKDVEIADKQEAKRLVEKRLSKAERVCVAKGVKMVKGTTAQAASDLSHRLCRAWRNEDRNGQELDIYMDLIEDDEDFEQLKKSLKETEDLAREIFNE